MMDEAVEVFVKQEIEALGAEALDLKAQRDALVGLAKALLLFYGGHPWTDGNEREWSELLAPLLGEGDHEATTKVLGNAARVAIAKAAQ